MKIAPNNVHARLELGKLYAGQGKTQEAEKLFQEYMKIAPNNVHARLELGKLYAGQGKTQEAEKIFQECMKIDPNDVYSRLELGKLYAEQGKTDLSKNMYQYILDAIGDHAFYIENRIKHIMKHMENDTMKDFHGVFVKDPVKLLEEIKEKMTDENKKIGYMSDIYVIESKECGYQGGRKGDGHSLDYVTVITLPFSPDKIITMFPSDNIFALCKEEKDNSDDNEQR